jgi:hypothetical protein
MPTTYTLIASSVLTSTTAIVTFSSIPANYTDLVVRASIRDASAGTINAGYYLFNNDNIGVAASYTQLTGNGSTAASSRFDSSFGAGYYDINGDSSTSNTFSSTEIYIPNYNATTNKPISVFSVVETNATTARIQVAAELYGTTAAITQLKLRPNSNFGAGSSFYLYGIKNS